MKVITFTDLRNNLASTLDTVVNDHTPVLVTRQNNQTAVLISLDDFNAYEETAHLMSNKKNAKQLNESIAQVRSGKTSKHDLIED